MDDIKVSIICLTYNHQKYIRQCLESLVNQETDFDYEIIVHDDASTDNTADIVREFEKQYPKKIFAIYQTENQYSKGIKISATYLVSKIRGKYVAYCEGDDFWTDKNKLQTQFEVMERNPNVSFCVHKVTSCDESGNPSDVFFPVSFASTQLISPSEFIKAICGSWEFQLSSFFVRSEDLIVFYKTSPLFYKVAPAGDIAQMMFFGNLGYTMYIDKAMSCYRLNAIGSWTSRNRDAGDRKRIETLEKFIDTWVEFDKYSDFKYHGSIKSGIEYYYFSIYKMTSRYKAMTQKCKNYLKKRPKIIVVYVYLSAWFPFVPSLVKWIFGKKPF